MTKKMKKQIVMTMILFFGFALLFGLGTRTKAASNIKTLTKNKTYTTKLTGTAKHKVRYTTPANPSDSYSVYLKLYIDGKTVYSLKHENIFYYDVQLLTVKSNRVLIGITEYTDNEYTMFNNIYEYKNGKLKLLKNLATLTRSSGTKATKLLTGWGRGHLYSLSGTKLEVVWYDATVATGCICYVASYKIGTNSIKKNSTSNTVRMMTSDMDIGKANPKWTAKYTLKAYTTAGGSKNAFTIKPGNKVTLLTMTVKNGKRYLQVKNSSGKKGWIVNPDTDFNRPNGYFKECFFAG